MITCGLDLHAKSSVFYASNRRGKKIADGMVPSTLHGFNEMMRRCGGGPGGVGG